MRNKDYTYAVARIRVKETSLFNQKAIDQLISQKDYLSSLRFLKEAGYALDNEANTKDVLASENKKLWDLMKELTGDDLSDFNVFRIQNDFHNLKVSVKSVFADVEPDSMFISGGTVSAKDMYKAVKIREYGKLPEFLGDVAAESMDTLLKTRDGQLCDVIIDRGCLDSVFNAGELNPQPVIKNYAELFTAFANIKIALRGALLNKNAEFYQKALGECKSLDKSVLTGKALKGYDEICDYILKTDYKDSVEYIKKSLSSFEKWCDDKLINSMKSQKSEPFTIGPLVAYIIAKQTELKMVRLILISKLNNLNEDKIRERIRELYV